MTLAHLRSKSGQGQGQGKGLLGFDRLTVCSKFYISLFVLTLMKIEQVPYSFKLSFDYFDHESFRIHVSSPASPLVRVVTGTELID